MKKKKWYSIGFAVTGILSVLLILFFVVSPIRKVGLASYLVFLRDATPYSRVIIEKYIRYKERKISKHWLERLSYVPEEEIPDIEWVEDSETSQGMNSFYLLDSYSDDVRPIILADWGNQLQRDKDAIFKSHITDEYPWCPIEADKPSYQYTLSDSVFEAQAGPLIDSWIYLPSKEKQPGMYALDFDFTTYTTTAETLQVGFATSSLANRFRFKLEYNEHLKFDVIDHGYLGAFLCYEDWKKYYIPYSLPIGESVHIRVSVINNVFAFYANDQLAMAVSVKDYQPEDAYWYLIFWNGYKEEGKEISFKLENFKILHPQSKPSL